MKAVFVFALVVVLAAGCHPPLQPTGASLEVFSVGATHTNTLADLLNKGYVPLFIPTGYEANTNWELLTSTNGRDWTKVPWDSYYVTNNVVTVKNDGRGGMRYFRYWWP